MNDIDYLLLEVKDILYKEPIVQEYFSLKKEIEENKELIELDKSVRHHQRMMCSNLENDDIYLKEKSLYEEELSRMNNHPLVVNFNNIKEEVLVLLKEVRDSLS